MLTDQEIFERRQLYDDVLLARKQLTELSEAIPETAPADLLCAAEGLTNEVIMVLSNICIDAWGALRDSALAGARKSVEVAEDRVKRFEAGEDV